MIDLLAEIVLGILVGACILLGVWVLFCAWHRRRRGPPTRAVLDQEGIWHLRPAHPTLTVLDREGMMEKLGAIHDAQAKFQEAMRQRADLWAVPSVAALFADDQVADGDYGLPSATAGEDHTARLAWAELSPQQFDVMMAWAVDVEDYELAAKLRDMGRPS